MEIVVRRYLLIGLGTVLAICAWAGVVFYGASEGWDRTALTDSTSPAAFMNAATEIADRDNIGNIGLVLIEDGTVVDSHFASTGDPVGPNSVFQVASLSKWITAWGVMALVEDGTIDLDAPVSTYLTRWELPPSEYDNDGVTVRRLLSHMAGLDDGLGYSGFDTRSDVQSLEASLNQARDASPDANGAVRVASTPGEEWDYSGGGYTLLQLLIEEVSGQPFSEFMKERIFLPLGMSHTTFDLDEANELGLATNFDAQGNPEPLRYYTSLAATSLHTTTQDMVHFLDAQMPGTENLDHHVLSPATIADMRVPHASQMGADIWGLGVMLYAPNNQGDYIVGHDGNNEPAINTAVRLDPDTGDAIIIFETGNPLLATELAGEWIFWKTGNVDNLMFVMALNHTVRLIGIGALLIVIAGMFVAWRSRRRGTKSIDRGK